MEKFCCCLDLVTGVTYFSFGLIVIWIIYFIQSAIFGGVGTSGVQTLVLILLLLGGIIWAAMWSGANVLCYLAVVYGIKKSMKFFLLPALCIRLVNLLLLTIIMPTFKFNFCNPTNQYFFISVFNVVVGVINAIINFVFLNLFG